jgi:hypothetical protein
MEVQFYTLALDNYGSIDVSMHETLNDALGAFIKHCEQLEKDGHRITPALVLAKMQREAGMLQSAFSTLRDWLSINTQDRAVIHGHRAAVEMTYETTHSE